MVSLWKILAHGIRNPTDHHRNLLPAPIGWGEQRENSLINRAVAP
jgi:hypothetical protein